MHAKSLQLCLTLCDPVDCSPPGFYVHGLLQERILEWVAMPSSRGSSQPRLGTLVSSIYLHRQVGSLPLAPPGKPIRRICNTYFIKKGGSFSQHFTVKTFKYKTGKSCTVNIQVSTT